MKKKIILSIALVLMLGTVVGCGCEKKEDANDAKVKVNTNNDVIKNQELEVFTFTNTSLVYEDNTSTLVTTVTNTSNETQYLKEFKIHVKNEKDEEIVELTGFVGDNIEGNSSTTISSSYAEDLTKAKKIEYEIVR